MASPAVFVPSASAARAPAAPLQADAAPQLTAPAMDAARAPHAPSWSACAVAVAAAVGAAARGQGRAAKRGLRSKTQGPRVVMQAASEEKLVPLTGCTLQAALKMRCDTSGASYAIYWSNENGKFAIAGEYVTEARKEELKGKGFERSFADESESYVLEASGDGPIATVYKSKEPLFVGDITASNMKRKDLAAKYGINQISFIPFEAGVLEFGTSGHWEAMPTCPLIPKRDMAKGFEGLGASYAMFWTKDGDEFKVVADYVLESRRDYLKSIRGDDKTFCSESRSFTLNANGDGAVATAARTNETVIVTDTSKMRRAELAKEFGITNIHLVPSSEGVFEFGVPAYSILSGSTLEAAMKMRCDTSGAGYALYWMKQGDALVLSGSYVTPARQAALAELGKSMSFAQASLFFTLDPNGDGPVATVLKTRKPMFIPDVAKCDGMKRKDLAIEYGIKSICLVPVPGGALEFGTSNESSTADWTCLEDANRAVIPKAEMATAFAAGATHVIFWWKQGDHYEVGASYILPERVRTLRTVRKDDRSYSAESSTVKISLDSLGPVATAARSGKEIVLNDPANAENFKRASLAKEFDIVECHFVPCRDGVLEWGRGVTSR
eukprot:gb/GFBE01021716.1/.p1 GENE.gb/GFBE01021716.1/~~gb/GFBE01021716.1/.p1  ORF type:complete len:611 (+),score=139.44 gb/GFBE01021716.1/:1-1833(+)